MKALSALYLAHGGGPLPLLGDAGHSEMIAALKDIAANHQKPSAIIVASAHWEEDDIRITAAARPEMIYDYFGFPGETYHYQYPASGHPILAEQIQQALVRDGIEASLDAKRGYDHGVFVPLMLMYPDADIPCIQVSLSRSLDPELHIRVGEAIGSVMDEGALLIGSGFSFHNMQAFKTPAADRKRMNEAFEAWLLETCTNEELSEAERRERLAQWEQAPHARYCHPREEHLLPLHVCYGAKQKPSYKGMELTVMDVKASMYLWA